MRPVLALVIFMGSILIAHGIPPAGRESAAGLKIELRPISPHVRSTEDIIVTVLFRSPEQDTTIWNALGWSPSTGLSLQVFDSTGHRVSTDFLSTFHPLPPDRGGKNALITISGASFAGFDSRIPARLLFPEPGHYTMKCVYESTLPRDYFHGTTIWGKEDGPIESTVVSVSVDK